MSTFKIFSVITSASIHVLSRNEAANTSLLLLQEGWYMRTNELLGKARTIVKNPPEGRKLLYLPVHEMKHEKIDKELTLPLESFGYEKDEIVGEPPQESVDWAVSFLLKHKMKVTPTNICIVFAIYGYKNTPPSLILCTDSRLSYILLEKRINGDIPLLNTEVRDYADELRKIIKESFNE